MFGYIQRKREPHHPDATIDNSENARARRLSLSRTSLLGLGEHGRCLQDGRRSLGLLTVHAQPLPISGRRPVHRTPDALEDLLDPTNSCKRYRVKVISSCFAAAVLATLDLLVGRQFQVGSDGLNVTCVVFTS
jgi:hypothetical protein